MYSPSCLELQLTTYLQVKSHTDHEPSISTEQILYTADILAQFRQNLSLVMQANLLKKGAEAWQWPIEVGNVLVALNALSLVRLISSSSFTSSCMLQVAYINRTEVWPNRKCMVH